MTETRQQRLLRRREGGLIVLNVEVNDVDLAEALVGHGLLSRKDANLDDPKRYRQALADAVGKFLALVSQIPVTRHAAPFANVVQQGHDRN